MTSQVDTAVSNVTFSGGVFAFDQVIKNSRGALSELNQTIYGPVEFRIKSISDPTVTVRNADTTSAGLPTFLYAGALPFGATSKARRLEFNDPSARLFTFDATVTGLVYTGSKGGVGSQTGDGTSEPPQPVTYSLFRETLTGTLPLGDPTGLTHGGGLAKEDGVSDPNCRGVTYADVEVTTKSDALFIDAALSSTAAVDMDFELRTLDGQLVARSASTTASERVSAAVQPNTKYILRVVGWANGPADYKIVSDQLLPQGSPNGNSGQVTPGSGGSLSGGTALKTPTALVTRLVRFTVNPLLKTVTVQLLK